MTEVNMSDKYDNQTLLLDDNFKVLYLNHFTDAIKKDLDDNELTNYLRLKCNFAEFVNDLSEDLTQTVALAYILQDIENNEYIPSNNSQYFLISRSILTKYQNIDCGKFSLETFTLLINGQYTFLRNRNKKILKIMIDRYYNTTNKNNLGVNIASVEKIYKML